MHAETLNLEKKSIFVASRWALKESLVKALNDTTLTYS